MAFTWTGSTDLLATLPSSGASPVVSGWSADALTVPPGMVSVPLSGALLVVCAAFSITPSAGVGSGPLGPGQIQYVFVDVNGTELVPTWSSAGNANSDPFQGYFVTTIPSVQKDSQFGPFGLSAGGTIRLKGTFQNGANGNLTGTLVAAIYDAANATERVRESSEGTTLSPVISTGFFPADGAPLPSFWGLFDRGIGSVAGLASSPPATSPSFTGAANWLNLVGRTNGAFFAAIGDYAGPAGGGVAFRIDYPAPTSVRHWDISAIVHSPGSVDSVISGHSFAQMIG